MLDEQGYFYIVDAILAVFLVLMVVLIINTAISTPSPDYSYDFQKIKNAQDIMEILSGKVDFEDRTFLGDITKILIENKNSKESIRQVCEISKNKFKSLNLTNYRFCETNILDNKVLSSDGDYSNAGNVSVAIRDYGNYSYILFVW